MLALIFEYEILRLPQIIDCVGGGNSVGSVPTVLAQGVDVSYSTRHVEESWHHLMKSEDTAKFKQIAVCNFDFLLAAVSNQCALLGHDPYLVRIIDMCTL